jgi:site-specific recombinase XerD
MNTIVLKPFLYRGRKCVGLDVRRNPAVNNVLRKMPKVKWSQLNDCWYVSVEPGWYHQLQQFTRQLASLTPSDFDSESALEFFLFPPVKEKVARPSRPSRVLVDQGLSAENRQALEDFIRLLRLKAYSESTIRTYRNEFIQLLKVLKNRSVNTLTLEDIKRYMVYAMKEGGISENTAHSRLNAIKFYFEQVMNVDPFVWAIPRPKKAEKLPGTFNQEEIAAIINSVKNTKHKTMLMLAYSAGLRVSEVVALRSEDVDSKRMIIFIRRAKGKKDRVVSLSPVMLVMLREYAREYGMTKGGYLFEGNMKGTAYSVRSLQEVLQAAKTKAGVVKPGSVHALRHSFATHLIDKGTDVTMIQKLLGHSDLKTTLRYLHTSNRDLLKIISPLDDLNLS